jgi:hypothetical protein
MKLPMYFKRQFLYIKFFNHLEGGFVKSKLSNNGVVRLRGVKMKMREGSKTSKYFVVLSNKKNLNMNFFGILKGIILNIKATKQEGPRLFDKHKAFKSVIQMLNYEARNNSMVQKTSKFNIEEQKNTIRKQDYGRN